MQPTKFEERLAPAVEAVIRFFQWTPSPLLAVVSFPCWASAVITALSHKDMTTLQQLVFGMGAALLGTVCGMALMLKTH